MAPLVTASAPGKVILMGEHAAVYGYPALVAAIDLRTQATVSTVETEERGETAAPLGTAAGSKTQPEIRIDLPDLDATVERTAEWMAGLARRAKERWQRFDQGEADFAPPASLLDSTASSADAAAAFVQFAIAEALSVARPGAEHLLEGVRVRSAAPTGAGFGSSAAVATAVVAAVVGALENRGGLAVQLQGAARDELVEGLALQVERLQHGRPSGVDTAAVRRGGVLRMERSDGSDGQVPGKLVASPLDVAADALSPFVLVHTGAAAESTGAVVTAVRRRHDAEPQRVDALLEKIGDCTEQMATALRGGYTDEVATTIRRNERLLEDLGVVPEPVRAFVRRIEEVGAVAKISGAGSLSGPGAGAVLVYDPGDVLSRFPIDEILGGLPVDLPEATVLRTRFGAPGLRTRSATAPSDDEPWGA